MLFNIDTTVIRGQRVEEDYIHAFRLEVLTGLRPGANGSSGVTGTAI